MKKLFFLILLFPSLCFGTVLFQDNFDSDSDWIGTQNSSGTNSCTSSCTVPGDWTGYYIEGCLCDGVSGEPGNHSMYVDTGAGYPSESTGCRSGKCLTHWQESCVASFQNSDAQLAKDLGSEYADLYFRWYVKFKPSFEMESKDGVMFKMWHIQHYDPGTNASWWMYFGSGPTNQPVGSGGLVVYGTTLFAYAAARCQNTYYCHGDINWTIGSLSSAYNAGGLFDGDWHQIIIRAARNSEIGVADGALELWIDGSKKSYASGYEGDDIAWNDTGSSQLRGFRLVTLPGNSYNQWDSSCTNMADCEQWYAVDDVKVVTTLSEATSDDAEEDTTAPSVTADDSTKSITVDSYNAEGDASDAVGVSGCKWRLASAPDADNGTACTGTTAWTCNTSGYSSGSNTLYIGCYDAAGNFGTDTVTVTYTPPTTTHTGQTMTGISIK